jgi:hypothetical protein
VGIIFLGKSINYIGLQGPPYLEALALSMSWSFFLTNIYRFFPQSTQVLVSSKNEINLPFYHYQFNMPHRFGNFDINREIVAFSSHKAEFGGFGFFFICRFSFQSRKFLPNIDRYKRKPAFMITVIVSFQILRTQRDHRIYISLPQFVT